MNLLFVGGNVRPATSPLVGPRGDDIYRNKDGGVRAGHGREEVARHRTAVGHARRYQVPLRPLDHRRPVEQHAPHLRALRQHGRDHLAVDPPTASTPTPAKS